MKTTANIILDTRRETKKGFPIKIYFYNGKKDYIPLKEYSPEIHWDGNNVKKSHPDHRRLHLKLKERDLKLTEEVNYCNDNGLDFQATKDILTNGISDNKELEILRLKQRLEELQESKSIGIIEFFNIIIEEKKVKGESVAAYEQARDQFQNFMVIDKDMNNVTYEFLNEFILYKRETSEGESGIMYYLRTLRALYKEAQKRRSLNVKQDNPFLGVIKTIKKKEVIEITFDDLEKLLHYEPAKPSLTKASAFKMKRNVSIWLFQILIGGHDYADIALLSWSDIKNSRVKFKRYKNRNKPDGGELVDNRLDQFSLSIIEEYGTKNEDRVFSWIPSPITNENKYNRFRDNIGRSLRTISKDLKLTSTIRTKSPRFVFRTICGNMMLNEFVVMQMQGHSPTGMTFSYQRRLPYNILDKEHQFVLDHIYENSNFILKL